MLYFYLVCLIVSGQMTAATDPSTPVDWAAAFSEVNEEQATGFVLHNNHKLSIPVGGPAFHQQGLQRLGDGGWAVSGSGKDKGYLYFTTAAGIFHSVYELPDYLEMSGSFRSLKYNHPGGFQITNHILAIGLENTDLRQRSYSRIVLLNVANPTAAIHYEHLDIVRAAESGKVMTAGAVAIAELRNCYLIIVGNWDSRRLDFYQTSSKDLSGKHTTMSECLGSWSFGPDAKPYQNINAYGDSVEELYLIGMYSEDRTTDHADLFRVNCSDWTNIRLSKKDEKHFRPAWEEPRFVHGSGSYYDADAGRLVFFSVEANIRNGAVRCNQW